MPPPPKKIQMKKGAAQKVKPKDAKKHKPAAKNARRGSPSPAPVRKNSASVKSKKPPPSSAVKKKNTTSTALVSVKKKSAAANERNDKAQRQPSPKKDHDKKSKSSGASKANRSPKTAAVKENKERDIKGDKNATSKPPKGAGAGGASSGKLKLNDEKLLPDTDEEIADEKNKNKAPEPATGSSPPAPAKSSRPKKIIKRPSSSNKRDQEEVLDDNDDVICLEDEDETSLGTNFKNKKSSALVLSTKNKRSNKNQDVDGDINLDLEEDLPASTTNADQASVMNVRFCDEDQRNTFQRLYRHQYEFVMSDVFKHSDGAAGDSGRHAASSSSKKNKDEEHKNFQVFFGAFGSGILGVQEAGVTWETMTPSNSCIILFVNPKEVKVQFNSAHGNRYADRYDRGARVFRWETQRSDLDGARINFIQQVCNTRKAKVCIATRAERTDTYSTLGTAKRMQLARGPQFLVQDRQKVKIDAKERIHCAIREDCLPKKAGYATKMYDVASVASGLKDTTWRATERELKLMRNKEIRELHRSKKFCLNCCFLPALADIYFADDFQETMAEHVNVKEGADPARPKLGATEKESEKPRDCFGAVVPELLPVQIGAKCLFTGFYGVPRKAGETAASAAKAKKELALGEKNNDATAKTKPKAKMKSKTATTALEKKSAAAPAESSSGTPPTSSGESSSDELLKPNYAPWPRDISYADMYRRKTAPSTVRLRSVLDKIRQNAIANGEFDFVQQDELGESFADFFPAAIVGGSSIVPDGGAATASKMRPTTSTSNSGKRKILNSPSPVRANQAGASSADLLVAGTERSLYVETGTNQNSGVVPARKKQSRLKEDLYEDPERSLQKYFSTTKRIHVDAVSRTVGFEGKGWADMRFKEQVQGLYKRLLDEHQGQERSIISGVGADGKNSSTSFSSKIGFEYGKEAAQLVVRATRSEGATASRVIPSEQLTGHSSSSSSSAAYARKMRPHGVSLTLTSRADEYLHTTDLVQFPNNSGESATTRSSGALRPGPKKAETLLGNLDEGSEKATADCYKDLIGSGRAGATGLATASLMDPTNAFATIGGTARHGKVLVTTDDSSEEVDEVKNGTSTAAVEVSRHNKRQQHFYRGAFPNSDWSYTDHLVSEETVVSTENEYTELEYSFEFDSSEGEKDQTLVERIAGEDRKTIGVDDVEEMNEHDPNNISNKLLQPSIPTAADGVASQAATFLQLDSDHYEDSNEEACLKGGKTEAALDDFFHEEDKMDVDDDNSKTKRKHRTRVAYEVGEMVEVRDWVEDDWVKGRVEEVLKSANSDATDSTKNKRVIVEVLAASPSEEEEDGVGAAARGDAGGKKAFNFIRPLPFTKGQRVRVVTKDNVAHWGQVESSSQRPRVKVDATQWAHSVFAGTTIGKLDYTQISTATAEPHKQDGLNKGTVIKAQANRAWWRLVRCKLAMFDNHEQFVKHLPLAEKTEKLKEEQKSTKKQGVWERVRREVCHDLRQDNGFAKRAERRAKRFEKNHHTIVYRSSDYWATVYPKFKTGLEKLEKQVKKKEEERRKREAQLEEARKKRKDKSERVIAMFTSNDTGDGDGAGSSGANGGQEGDQCGDAGKKPDSDEDGKTPEDLYLLQLDQDSLGETECTLHSSEIENDSDFSLQEMNEEEVQHWLRPLDVLDVEVNSLAANKKTNKLLEKFKKSESRVYKASSEDKARYLELSSRR
ncbi:unnamed protein product [Amoebophrya sp. A120]|nr:unnamed protein product [Amoebophrya sp. A120]|eukprot:GSA120T00010458001.1